MIQLSQEPVQIAGVPVRNHLILAAGVLGTCASSLLRMLRQGAGAVVTKSIGPEPRYGHAGPCVVVLEDGVMNAMGLPNPSKEFVNELALLDGEPVIVSIFGGNPDEFHEVAGWFADKAQAFELNVSCPHAAGFGAQIGTNPDLVHACTEAVKEWKRPVWVKLTPNVTDITAIGRAAESGGADAIVAINTVRAMRISTGLKRPVLGNTYGGLSGRAIFPIAVRCVYELYEACSIPIIGCGGVSCAEDVIEMMMAGAQGVEIGSAVAHEPDIFRRISDELYASDGIFADEIVGCAHVR
ncbi:dihydroorotate dehydrogenase [Methanospirillum sp.]|uniref:dihydroorotate dehydrogenase n=2 Tax=Methanospirillum sp. TaxID=45200 RepID=UPI002C377623|nr:dihydroorotate dehydrogenase [Methanospirillum sp.]HOL42510.1 dihydroorotate dehydrogenase [Methanospirillum sp.]HPP78591.1 dihydroorotate dehydrogenase [Methanospirillum sp.]